MNDFRKEMLDEFIRMAEKHNAWKAYEHNFNFRTSMIQNQMMEEELEDLARLGIRISKNDLINLCINLVLGYAQNEKQANNHYRLRSTMTAKNYMNSYKSELKQRRMEILMKMDDEWSEMEAKKKHEIRKRRKALDKIDREMNELNERDPE